MYIVYVYIYCIYIYRYIYIYIRLTSPRLVEECVTEKIFRIVVLFLIEFRNIFCADFPSRRFGLVKD